MNSNKASLVIEQLPEDYSNYLKVSLDPFHDASIRFEGAPTSRNASSVVLCINQERTYNADDFGIDPQVSNQWDAHFVMYPFLTPKTLVGGVELNSSTGLLTLLDPTGAKYWPTMYPMSVNGVASGSPTYSTSTYNAAPKVNILGLHNQTLVSYLTGSNTTQNTRNGPGRRTLRIVGESFEVVDESPDIYAQGACTVYRYPLDVTPANRLVRFGVPTQVPDDVPPPTHGPLPNGFPYYGNGNDSLTLSTMINTYDVKAPPVNTSVAVLIPGSKTWRAKEGCYCVGTQYASEVPFKTLDTTPTIFTGYQPSVGSTFDGVDAIFSFADAWILQEYQGSVSQPVSATNRNYYVSTFGDPVADALYPYNMSGAYFTGLSSQYGTLRLRYRVYVEILTDPCDNTLAPLGSPTLPYDQTLQEFCMRVIAQQEAGVPQTMNPKGEKWRQVLGHISKVMNTLTPAATLLSPELGAAVGAAGASVGSISKIGAKKAKAKPKAKAKGK